MPTYSFRCAKCSEQLEAFMSIREYLEDQPVFVCCSEPMQRHFQVSPGKLYSADYEGLRASDGTDISTRTKHRQYMKERGLTTIDDYAETWKRDAKEREQRLQGVDPSRREDIAEAVRYLKR